MKDISQGQSILIIGVFVLCLTVVGVYAITIIQDNTAITENAYARLETYPAYSNGWGHYPVVTLTPKMTGTANVTFEFDQPMKGSSMYKWANVSHIKKVPVYEVVDRSFTCPSDDYGIWIEASQRWAYCYYETNDYPVVPAYINFTHKYNTIDVPTKTIYWTETAVTGYTNEVTYNMEFKEIDNSKFKVTQGNGNYYYTLTNIDFVDGVEKKIKLNFMPSTYSGKYNIIFWRWNAGVQQILLRQDPWWTGTPDFVFNETADFDGGVKQNTTTITDRYNQSADNVEVDFPYADKDTDLISYWRMSNNTATITDLTGTNDMTNSGAVWTAAGKFDGAWDFTRGDNDNLQVENKASTSTTVGTLSAWIYLDDVTNGVTKSVFGYGGGTSGAAGLWDLRINCDGSNARTAMIARGDGNTPILGAVQGANTMVVGTWYHVVVTSSGTAWKLYLNGVESTNAWIGANQGYWIGDIDVKETDYTTIGILRNNNVWANAFDGKIDEVKLYDRELSTLEVQELYNFGNRYIDSTPVGHPSSTWKTDEMTVPAGKQLENFTVNLSAANGNCYLDYIVVTNSTNAIKYFNDTNMITDGLRTYVNISYGSCDFACINETETWNITLGFESDGSCTPVLENVIGYYTDDPVPPVIEDYTSLYAVEFLVNDTTFGSTDYVEIFEREFNTTTLESFGLMSSFNLQKLTGGGTNTVSARVYIDGVLYHQEDVRTIVNNARQGSTGLLPIGFNLTAGSHNLSVEMARSGNGNVELSNQDWVLGKFNTTNNHLVRGQLKNVSYDYNSQTWSNGYNWTVSKTADSNTYYGGKIGVTSTAHDHIWLNLTNYNTSESSPNSLRHIASATDLGSIGLSWINTNNSGTHNMTIGSKTMNGETISVSGALFDFDLMDSDGDVINNFQANNVSISEETPMIISGADYQLIDEAQIRMRNGTGFFISSTLSFNSSSSNHTPSFRINVSNSTDGCESNKERYLSSNDDIGNAYFYVVCNKNLVVEQNYTVHLWGASESGETMQVSSVSLSALEVTNFSLAELPTVPIIAIQSPTDTEEDNDIWFNVTTNQDNTDLCWYHVDGNLTYDWTMTNLTGNWYNQTTLDDGIHYVHIHCNNTDGLTGQTDDFYFFIGEGIEDLPMEVIPLISISVAFLLLWVSRKIESNDALQILYFGLSILFIIITLFTNTVLSGLAGYDDLIVIQRSGLIGIIFVSVFLVIRLLLNFTKRTVGALDGDDND